MKDSAGAVMKKIKPQVTRLLKARQKHQDGKSEVQKPSEKELKASIKFLEGKIVDAKAQLASLKLPEGLTNVEAEKYVQKRQRDLLRDVHQLEGLVEKERERLHNLS